MSLKEQELDNAQQINQFIWSDGSTKDKKKYILYIPFKFINKINHSNMVIAKNH